MPPFPSSPLIRSKPIYQIFGANTDVGKTVVSTALCSAIRSRRLRNGDASAAKAHDVLFLKPVQTGPESDGDVRHVGRHVPGITTKCLYRFDAPLSPHLAARGHSRPTDSQILGSICKTLQAWAHKAGRGNALVETAGGILSPGPNGSLQADLYRPLRLPAILVADARLGGISATISAYESLTLRGQDVEAIVVFGEESFRNYEFLGEFAGSRGLDLLVIPEPPERRAVDLVGTPGGVAAEEEQKERQSMADYYARVSNKPEVGKFLRALESRHHARIERLESMAEKAHEVVWYPFTQHHGMTATDIRVIDSAYGDYFQTLSSNAKPEQASNQEKQIATSNDDKALLQSTFDGSASWWTQGLGHGDADLSRTAAYAAGRYGHVMFPGTIHEPALSLCQRLLKLSRNPRLAKVFFADNGSVGMEVAIKMGLRAASKRYGWSPAGCQGKVTEERRASDEEIGILGLSGSYHGDTLGAMECSEPSTFNKKVEWYRGRGHWLDFPKVQMTRGVWQVVVPEGMRRQLGSGSEFANLASIFDLTGRKETDLAHRYKAYIRGLLEDLVVRKGRKFGALIIEPVVLGAGGMLFSDPLFQHLLVQTVRENPHLFHPETSESSPSTPSSWSGLPIIFDEVFTGLGRLGRLTASSFLDIQPDIVVNSKLLTGGLMPLSTTMASSEIFEAFNSPEKSDALLHGHSYTANPVGCSVAEHTLQRIDEITTQTKRGKGHWSECAQDWKQQEQREEQDPEIWSLWSHSLVRDLSFAGRVEGVWALGTVLRIALHDEDGQGGYTSTAAAGLQKHLTAGDAASEFNVHARVLGNVLYLMGSLTTTRESLKDIESLLRKHLL